MMGTSCSAKEPMRVKCIQRCRLANSCRSPPPAGCLLGAVGSALRSVAIGFSSRESRETLDTQDNRSATGCLAQGVMRSRSLVGVVQDVQIDEEILGIAPLGSRRGGT